MPSRAIYAPPSQQGTPGVGTKLLVDGEAVPEVLKISAYADRWEFEANYIPNDPVQEKIRRAEQAGTALECAVIAPFVYRYLVAIPKDVAMILSVRQVIFKLCPAKERK